MLSPFDCYELCVQSPRHITTFLRAAHGHPLTLREDFAGTARIARRWAEESLKSQDGGTALAIEIDPATIKHARSQALNEARADPPPNLTILQGECTTKDAPAFDTPADVVFVGNFSIGYLHRRADLMRYLRYTHQRLAKAHAGPGLLALDTYGGTNAFTLGSLRRRHPSRGREQIHYHWQHEAADPTTAMVTNSISFDIELDGEIIHQYPRAFVYHWRLWSLPELREALHETGYHDIQLHLNINLAPGQQPTPITIPADLGDNWVVLITARA